MIYDTFCFFNELDILKIRLNILSPFVDYFVIGESKETFSGKSKKLFYQNSERFEKWKDKIIHLEIPLKETNDPFERAAFQKNYLKSVLEHRCNDEDIVFFGDVDEIWQYKRMFKEDFAGLPNDKVFNLQQLNYSYYLNNRSSEEWIGTVVGKWKIIKTNSVNYWRANHNYILSNGGWHFTNCIGYDNILKKLDSYDHQEANIPWVKDGLKARIEANTDYLGRTQDWTGKPFKMWLEEKELPEYILDNKDKYKHLWKS